MKQRKWTGILPKRVILLPLWALLWNTLTYQGSALLTASWHHYDLALPLDRAIPLVPWTIVIYFGCFVFWALHLMWLAWRNDAVTRWFYTADFLSKLLCLVFFLLLPTVMHRPEVEGTGFWSDAIRFLYQIDKPYNLFPSIHCMVSWLCWISVRQEKGWYRWFALAAAIAICISTLTTRQHVLLDVFGGIAAAELSWLAAKKPASKIP